MPKPPTGQASAEYVAAVTLAAMVLAGAGVAVGPPELAGAVSHTIRTGLCIVGGDVCRAADARAAGLAPCTVSQSIDRKGRGITLGVATFGTHREWSVARRSDGSVAVVKREGSAGGVTEGLGVTATPLGLDAGLNGSYTITVTAARGWEFRDAAAARGFLAGLPSSADDGRWPPTWRSGELGEQAAALLGAQAAGNDILGIEASAERAAGARIGPGHEVHVYLEAEVSGDAFALGAGHSSGVGTGRVMIEYVHDRSGPRELIFRRAHAGAGAGQVVETAAHLDLHVPENRARAEAVLASAGTASPAAIPQLIGLIRYTVSTGVVERAVYATRESEGDFALAVRAGLTIGYDQEKGHTERRLVHATARIGGGPELERYDCTPEGA